MWPFSRKVKAVGQPKKLNGELIKLGQSHPNTPDYLTLELQKFVAVFVPDETQTGQPYEYLLKGDMARKCGTAFTARPFVMFRMKEGDRQYPILLTPNKRPGIVSRTDAYSVRGEIHLIRPWQVVRLDDHKQNGRAFSRVRIDLNFPVREVEEYDRVMIRRDAETGRVLREGVETARAIRTDTINVKCSAFAYIGRDEFFFWNNYDDTSFKPLRPVRPQDPRRDKYYHWNVQNR